MSQACDVRIDHILDQSDQSPMIVIEQLTADPTYATSQKEITVGGRVENATSVSVTNVTTHSPSNVSANFQGNAGTWISDPIPLAPGDNEIEVSAKGDTGVARDTLVVRRQ